MWLPLRHPNAVSLAWTGLLVLEWDSRLGVIPLGPDLKVVVGTRGIGGIMVGIKVALGDDGVQGK